MLTEVIKADTIHEAVDNAGRHNVIYFDGWDGLGASAVLRAVSQRLTPIPGSRGTAAAGLEFSHIFHIDCSKWESKRAMQKMVAKQMELPASVMEMFDAQDEEDDYNGVAKDSRLGLPQVAEAINEHIQKLNRFLLIYHNGSNEEIDLESLGFPLWSILRSKVLWSFQGRFRFYPQMKVDNALKNSRTTTVSLSAAVSNDSGEDKLTSDILRLEAEEVAREMKVNTSGIDWPAAAKSYFLYAMKLCGMGNHIHDYDMSTHAYNCWRCDGGMMIHGLQQGDMGTTDHDHDHDGVDRLWLSFDALRHEITLDVDGYENPYFRSSVKTRLLNRVAYWTSPTYVFMLIPSDLDGQIPEGMFQPFDKLHVLKLSECRFSFTSHPFLCCQNVRFLSIDHCRDGRSTAEAVKEEDIGMFFQRLWVLDVRSSNKAFLSDQMMSFMTQLRELFVMGEGKLVTVPGRLNNIHKLRVTELSHGQGIVTFAGMDKLELLEFSGNTSISHLYVESNCSLETVIISGPTSLFYIQLKGCAKLKNLLLSGSFPHLFSINVFGAVVEILDLSAVTALRLQSVRLLGCEKLCAILWPSSAEYDSNKYVGILNIDTKQKESTAALTSRPPYEAYYWDMAQLKIKFYWHITVRDERILRSLEPVKDYFGSHDAHVEVSMSPSRAHPCADDDASTKDGGMRSSSGQHVQVQQAKDTATYADVVVILRDTTSTQPHQQDEAINEEGNNIGIMWTCPRPPDMPSEGCYIYIEDPISSRTKSQGVASITLPGFICAGAKILHVHDSLHITDILTAPTASSAAWNKLEWCRVERCPKLECVFSPLLGGPEGRNNHTEMFKKLRTTWVSHLLKARYVWNWTGSPSSAGWSSGGTFQDLTLLHLDCCPRIKHVIHCCPSTMDALDMLETLDITWCGDLSEAFVFISEDPTNKEEWHFFKLKHIHLHELPKLRNICNTCWIISAPELETIKVRGCWSLRTLPIVKSNNMVKCDCEKEWWDRLKWESKEHESHYKPIHPRYDKKTMLRGSVLR